MWINVDQNISAKYTLNNLNKQWNRKIALKLDQISLEEQKCIKELQKRFRLQININFERHFVVKWFLQRWTLNEVWPENRFWESRAGKRMKSFDSTHLQRFSRKRSARRYWPCFFGKWARLLKSTFRFHDVLLITESCGINWRAIGPIVLEHLEIFDSKIVFVSKLHNLTQLNSNIRKRPLKRLKSLHLMSHKSPMETFHLNQKLSGSEHLWQRSFSWRFSFPRFFFDLKLEFSETLLRPVRWEALIESRLKESKSEPPESLDFSNQHFDLLSLPDTLLCESVDSLINFLFDFKLEPSVWHKSK